MTTAVRAPAREKAPMGTPWWLLLVTGGISLLYGYIVLQFDVRTVWAISIFAGIGFLAQGLMQLTFSAIAPGPRWLHLLLGTIGVVAGVAALAWPDATFVVLAALVGWVLLLRGTLSIVAALMLKDEEPDWWIGLVLGLIEIALAIWVSRYEGRSMVFLVLWVGTGALIHGVIDIVGAFRLRTAQREQHLA